MSYREAFDHLGNKTSGPEPWTTSDLVRCTVAVLLVIAAIWIW